MIRLELTDNKEVKIEIDEEDTYHNTIEGFAELTLHFYKAIFEPQNIPLEVFLTYVSASAQKRHIIMSMLKEKE